MKRHPITEYIILLLVFLSGFCVELYLTRGYDGFLGGAVFFGLLALISEIEVVGHEICQALGHGDDEPGILRRVLGKLHR